MTDTLQLDKRQRAMLAEMGVRVWSPLSEEAVMAAPEVSAEVVPEVAVVVAAPSAPKAMANVPVAKPTPIQIQRPEGVDQMDWAALQSTVTHCQACGLCESRQNTVFGVGAPALEGQAPQIDWLIVGEAPGEDEDAQGEPFVGQAGALLDNMLRAMNLSRKGEKAQEGQKRSGVYIANLLKCRPPGNRNPKLEEVEQCLPYLE